MSKNIEAIPFTEAVERVIQIARIESVNDESRARGAVNDIAVRKIPSEEDWNFFLASSALTCDAEYKVGTLSVNTQDTVVTFSSDVTITAAMTGRKLKANDNGDIYTFTRANNTGGTINPPLSGDRNITSGAYTIFQPIYALAPNFDRFPKNGGLMLFQGGKPTVLPEKSIQGYFDEYTPFPGTPGFCRLVEAGTDGAQRVEVVSPPQKAINLPYEYLFRPPMMRETTAGVANISAAGTTVTGSAGASRFTEATTGWYFRIDAFGTGADSEWFRIISIAHDSSMTLQSAFGLSGAVSAGYTLCPAPMMPAKMHMAVLHGAISAVISDQDDPLFKLHEEKYREIINDGKRTYKTRIYQQDVPLIAEDWNYRR